MIKLKTPPQLTPKPKPAKDGWGKWYNTTHKTQTFAERNQINPKATFKHTTDNLTTINTINITDHYNNNLKKQLETQPDKTSQTLYIALHRIEQTLETIHGLQRNIRTLTEQHLKQQQCQENSTS